MKFLLLAPAAFALCAMAQDTSVAMQPGQWEFTTAMTGLEMPSASPETAAGVRAALVRPNVSSRCVSPEEAADPAARLANPGGSVSNCAFSRRIFAGARIDIAGRCTGADGAALELSLSGTYSSTEMRATFRADGRPTMLFTGTMSGRRIGECAPGAS